MIYDVGIVHKKDGYKKYDRDQFNKYTGKLIGQISTLLYSGVQLVKGDIISVFIDEDESGDSVFYKITGRQIWIADNRLKITFTLNDL